MPLRGKQADEGVLLDLLKLRIDSGDNKLKSHFEKCRRNAIYTSPRIQNELINLCGEVIQENVISEVRKTMAYSILADETADVSGKEQLSIGVRFYDESKSKIREEFVGFVELKAQNASAIAEAIDNFLISSNLSKEDCVGFGFDGCSTMAGKEGGVQAILRKKYPRALYFHCSSHKLNLVVNDANAVPEIRNTVATVKDVITFFRESTTRRNYAPNLSRLCETRWSEKYKSIRKFSQHFSELVKSLETLSVEGNYATRKSAYQLHSAVTKPVFIVSLQTIAKYSAVIEPVVNALQAKSIDMISVGKHIKNIKDILRNDREFPDRISNEILQKARAVAMDLNIEISVPRLAHKQTHRSNPPSDNDNEYWRRSLIIPYIDSLISSLNIRFSQENTPAFALSRLHPLYMTKTSIADLHKNAESFQEFYNLDITGELNLWHNLWVTKALSDDQLKDIEVVDLFKEANIFYPAVRKALIILSTIPCTTATVERSFSTLRRVKTWLRSTMGEERLTVVNWFRIQIQPNVITHPFHPKFLGCYYVKMLQRTNMGRLTLSLMEYITYIGGNANSRVVLEGEEVVNAGHIILYGKSELTHFSLKVCALCLQTSALQSNPHKIKGTLTISNKFAAIKQMYCTCKAGAGGQCKHISALLILLTRTNLLELEDISKTQLACAWSGRKGIVQDKYKAFPVPEMRCIKAAVPGPNIFLNPNGQKSMFEFFIKNLSDSAIAKHWKGRPKNSSELGDSNTANMPTENIVEESGSMQIDFQSSCCAALYENIMNEEQDRLFHMEQNSQEWHEARKYRITGSRCYEIYTYRGMDWEIKSKKYFWPKSFTNKYVKHGQMYEKPARESFISKTGHIVRECGMITSAGDKWLGFSPDGVVLNLDREPIALLEIKCLYSGITMTIKDCLQECNFISKENGRYTLKKKHKYYGQVQLGMGILNLNKCYMCLYASYDDSCEIITIENDYQFTKTMLMKIKNNYFSKMLHVLCEQK
nr:unnamed protein product [Callosobruchus analis]